MPERLLTTEAAAERLSISERTLRREIAAGRLSVVRIGRSVRICPDDIARFILASKGRGQPCRSKNVIELGVYGSRSADKRLEHRLGQGPRSKTRSNSKPASAAMPLQES